MGYYFFAASLPALSLDAPPPLSFDRFLSLCREHLRAADLRALEELLRRARPESRSAFVRTWCNKDTQVRNAVVRLRAGRLRQDSEADVRPQNGVDLLIEKRVAEAFSRPTPAERERALDRLRWTILDELAGFDPFTGAALLAYALKLKLVERWAAMNPEAGRERVDKLVNRDSENNTRPATGRE
ncbi:MAG: DUF2764 family protein [Verrucomicrobiota bacterium]|nr:DUF2764 family protein [Verrucomicrobiota bacterium]